MSDNNGKEGAKNGLKKADLKEDDKALSTSGKGGGEVLPPPDDGSISDEHLEFAWLFDPRKADDSFLHLESITKLCLEMGSAIPSDGRIPAGLTYIGQMISHDIVPSTNNRFPRQNGADVTPFLNLDSLYGDDKFLDEDGIISLEGKFILGNSVGEMANRSFYYEGEDLLRGDTDPRIPELRNDENVLISQLHLFWLRFHNKVVDKFFATTAKDKRFGCAKKFVVSVFQRIVVDDFLYHVLDPEIYNLYCLGKNGMLEGEGGFIYNSDDKPFEKIPVEFSHAVFRFGHSMVRRQYQLQPGDKAVGLADLFITDHAADIQKEKVVDWSLFFGRSIKENEDMQFASKIDLRIASPMGKMPGNGFTRHIVGLNLKANIDGKVPTGGEAIDWIRDKRPKLAWEASLYDDAAKNKNENSFIEPTCKGTVLGKISVDLSATGEENIRGTIEGKQPEELPLWFYILIENNSLNQRGMRLGKLGSIITAEVIMNSIKGAKALRSELDFKVKRPVKPEATKKGKSDEEKFDDELSNNAFNGLDSFYQGMHRLSMLDLVKFVKETN